MENLIFSLNPTVPIFLMMTTFFSAFTLTGGAVFSEDAGTELKCA